MAATTTFDASDDIVEVVADSGQGKTFSVHRSLLLQSSDYLRSAVSISESSNLCFKAFGPVMVYTEVPGDAVRCFVQWLYTGQLAPNDGPTHINGVLSLFKHTTTQLHNTGFRDFLVDKTIDLVTGSADSTAENVYAVLDYLDDVNGGMLMFLTDWLVHSKLHKNTLYAEIGEHLASCKNADAIYRGLAQSFLELKVSDDNLPPWLENRCQYHEHPAITCCSKSPGVVLAESELSTPPPAPRKRNTKYQHISDPFEDEEIVVSNKKYLLDSTEQTPTRVTRSALRPQVEAPKPQAPARGRAPNWTFSERVIALKLYMQYPEAGHSQIAAKLSADYCAIRGYARTGGGLGAQYREMLGGVLEETRAMIPAKIKEFEVEASMEMEDEEVGGFV